MHIWTPLRALCACMFVCVCVSASVLLAFAFPLQFAVVITIRVQMVSIATGPVNFLFPPLLHKLLHINKYISFRHELIILALAHCPSEGYEESNLTLLKKFYVWILYKFSFIMNLLLINTYFCLCLKPLCLSTVLLIRPTEELCLPVYTLYLHREKGNRVAMTCYALNQTCLIKICCLINYYLATITTVFNVFSSLYDTFSPVHWSAWIGSLIIVSFPLF